MSTLDMVLGPKRWGDVQETPREIARTPGGDDDDDGDEEEENGKDRDEMTLIMRMLPSLVAIVLLLVLPLVKFMTWRRLKLS